MITRPVLNAWRVTKKVFVKNLNSIRDIRRFLDSKIEAFPWYLKRGLPVCVRDNIFYHFCVGKRYYTDLRPFCFGKKCAQLKISSFFFTCMLEMSPCLITFLSEAMVKCLNVLTNGCCQFIVVIIWDAGLWNFDELNLKLETVLSYFCNSNIL